MAPSMRKDACVECACPNGWMNLGVTQNSPRWGALCYPCGGPERDTRGDPRNLTPEGDRMLSNNYLGRDKHLDGQCSCTPAARCRAFQRVTEHIIRDHSEALTRKWLDSKYQESFYPPMEGVTELADEDATCRIEELEEELQEMSEKNTFIEEEVAGKLEYVFSWGEKHCPPPNYWGIGPLHRFHCKTTKYSDY